MIVITLWAGKMGLGGVFLSVDPLKCATDILFSVSNAEMDLFFLSLILPKHCEESYEWWWWSPSSSCPSYSRTFSQKVTMNSTWRSRSKRAKDLFLFNLFNHSRCYISKYAAQQCHPPLDNRDQGKKKKGKEERKDIYCWCYWCLLLRHGLLYFVDLSKPFISSSPIYIYIHAYMCI